VNRSDDDELDAAIAEVRSRWASEDAQARGLPLPTDPSYRAKLDLKTLTGIILQHRLAGGGVMVIAKCLRRVRDARLWGWEFPTFESWFLSLGLSEREVRGYARALVTSELRDRHRSRRRTRPEPKNVPQPSGAP
jgi:hypothetical protein